MVFNPMFRFLHVSYCSIKFVFLIFSCLFYLHVRFRSSCLFNAPIPNQIPTLYFRFLIVEYEVQTVEILFLVSSLIASKVHFLISRPFVLKKFLFLLFIYWWFMMSHFPSCLHCVCDSYYPPPTLGLWVIFSSYSYISLVSQFTAKLVLWSSHFYITWLKFRHHVFCFRFH